jgi:hypothetical protein
MKAVLAEITYLSTEEATGFFETFKYDYLLAYHYEHIPEDRDLSYSAAKA